MRSPCAAGHLVRPGPADEAAFAISVLSGTVSILEVSHSGQFVTLRACAGSGVARVAYLGAVLDLPLEVSADVADPACP